LGRGTLRLREIRALITLAGSLAACGEQETADIDAVASEDNITVTSAMPEKREPCRIMGSSIDQDPNGLNVRAEPNAKSEVLGKLYSVADFEDEHGEESGAVQKLFGPQFTVTAVKGDWIQIIDAERVSEGPSVEKKNFTGAGWVHFSLVKAAPPQVDIYSNLNNGFEAPSERARIADPDGTTNYANAGRDTPDQPRLIACSGAWAKVRYQQSGKLGPNRRWIAYSKADIARRLPVEAWFKTGEADQAGDSKATR
jgi:hypothetical protein